MKTENVLPLAYHEGVENISEDGEYFRFYFKNGAPYYGKEDLEIFTIDSKKYAFNTAGEMQTGKQSIRLSDGTAANYYFDEEGNYENRETDHL